VVGEEGCLVERWKAWANSLRGSSGASIPRNRTGGVEGDSTSVR